jgi:hypothetical protein
LMDEYEWLRRMAVCPTGVREVSVVLES